MQSLQLQPHRDSLLPLTASGLTSSTSSTNPFRSFCRFARIDRWKSTAACRCATDAGDNAAVTAGPVFSVTPRNESDVDYLGESTKGDFNVNFDHLEALGMYILVVAVSG